MYLARSALFAFSAESESNSPNVACLASVCYSSELALSPCHRLKIVAQCLSTDMGTTKCGSMDWAKGLVVFKDDKSLASSGEDCTKHVPSAAAETQVTTSELNNPNEHPKAEYVRSRFADWEICCFCVHPPQRRRGPSRLLVESLQDLVRSEGPARLVANYSVEGTGDY